MVLSTSRFSPERLAEIRKTCMNNNLELFQLSILIKPLISHDDVEEPLEAVPYGEEPALLETDTAATELAADADLPQANLIG